MLTEADINIIRQCNKYQLDIVEGEFWLVKRAIKHPNPILIIENILIERTEKAMLAGNVNNLFGQFFAASVVFNQYGKEAAIKWRRYSNMFRHIHMLTSSEISWKTKYIGDSRCDQCKFLTDHWIDIEDDLFPPAAPVEGCRLPHYNICVATPVYEASRDENGRPIRHGKDYSKLLQLKLSKDIQ